MAVYRVDQPAEHRKAGPTDLIRLLPAAGGNPLFVRKWLLEALVSALVRAEIVHLSGPTGSAKSSLIEALGQEPANVQAVCEALSLECVPLKVHPIEMAIFESPGELYQRRGLNRGTTFDEPSPLVQALRETAKPNGQCRHVIWLREIGRVHSASIQGGLLDLMMRGDILLPDGTRVDGSRIAWVADSNYQAEGESVHTLVTFDDALKRRFSVNLTLDYLSAEQEVQVLEHFVREGHLEAPADGLIGKVVKLGQVVRRHRVEGNLQSVAPPTIYGYLAFLRMARALPHLSLQHVAAATFLGNASLEDQKLVVGVFSEVFGLQVTTEDDPTSGGGLF